METIISSIPGVLLLQGLCFSFAFISKIRSTLKNCTPYNISKCLEEARKDGRTAIATYVETKDRIYWEEGRGDDHYYDAIYQYTVNTKKYYISLRYNIASEINLQPHEVWWISSPARATFTASYPEKELNVHFWKSWFRFTCIIFALPVFTIIFLHRNPFI